ncbi:MAG: cysteine--tRNA ligase [Candidatus Zambryskibacteria bacterium RIFCSPHIGHO2_01_FULL_43_25]|uniref:Cysteine--tRNA ligase n=1 Tax=Candidatus Zambryskibacteria bacterium RIFCSPLOWO2_01_FULL_45_21 TaxID=1802761 RepID=A0A1G2U309_9BACT|nr:MAG: cysteine--tRNA ligase [Candidatus Zambryskibacteria bacterium RIFCSPHIGHO2_01_FULL_43_25]OHB01044.1 MAG: cysteine--tRNA ligase [Candidatus Zambryskibacteria bacterium RIFCSPHIGHO2_12_FULL_44_12b]OHB03911.1 MAG: cysteine--tRNA ligase [Candidatus Zambryskibacteria bacterium RIFCSPLOWO2_01_FULL_45_21]
MIIHLYNTLSGKKEEFAPLKQGEVSMYHCGPTVYDYAHIGNMRSFVFADIIRRTFENSGYKVNQVMNITDVGHLTGNGDLGQDKIEEGAQREGKSAEDIIRHYSDAFFQDLERLNIETAGTKFPRATEHIDEQIELIKKLEQGGFTYKISDGVYFDTSKFKQYGKLGSIDIEGQREGARVEANPEKKNPADFALWKFSPDTSEKRQQEWDSPWGIGFPGWHIECSAMSIKYLGETFDIHTGGIDHIPVHHNNEIAQSECATGKTFVNYWLHNAFITVESKKMAKSEGNFMRVTDLMKREIHPLSYRYWLLTSHYRTPANFTFKAVEGTQIAFESLVHFVARYSGGKIKQDIINDILGDFQNDFNTAYALARLHHLIEKEPTADAAATIVAIDSLTGLSIERLAKEVSSIDSETTALIEERKRARDVKDWKISDSLREEIESRGYMVSDTPEGALVFKKLSSLV